MKTITRLKGADKLDELAKLLSFTPRGLSFVVYKIDTMNKYRVFEIAKKSGGTRTIHAPEKQLALLQTRLANLLYSCVAELQQEKPKLWHASHGFQKQKTTISNANPHRRRRFVFNLDLEDFFGSINFGRVRGFFINDKNFKLNPKIATIIAQIACHRNALPQGSPCSPVISNLIGNILDLRLIALARETKCTYTRYADDLTFSTNEMLFPTEIATNPQGSTWEVGIKLHKEIEQTGFKINPRKTRMSLRRSRQTVTGLVVNSKVNIKKDYYRSARAMCNAVFSTGEYHIIDKDKNISDLRSLEGILSHIFFVKARRDRAPKTNKMAIEANEFKLPSAPVELYRKFLFYRLFVAPKAPLVVTEGISDITYIQCAIRALAKSFPALALEKDGKHTRLLSFLNPSGTTRDVLNLGHGASGQASLIMQYFGNLKKYKHKPLDHPVIILCDNDDGPKTVFKNAKSKSGLTISTSTTDQFYHLGENLYIVKVPEGNPATIKEIENLFDSKLLTEKLDGKSFDPKKEHGDPTSYGKVVFAEKIVRPNAGEG